MNIKIFLYSGITFFFLGIALRSFVAIDRHAIYFLLVLIVALFLYYWHNRTKYILITSISILFFVLGVARFGYAEWNVTTSGLALDEHTELIIIDGVVVGEVVEKETTQRFIVETDETRIIVTADRFPSVSYGNVLELTGEVRVPERFETDVGRDFDYPRYLEARGVTHQMFRPSIKIGEDQKGSIVTTTLFKLKESFLDRLRAVVPEPHVALLGGLVVGSQEAMGEELLQAFRVTGLIHIVVLSGYNVTIVAESIMRFFGFLPKRYGIFIGAASIVLFAILTGGTATVVRASIMALLVLVARATGRTYEITRALFLTAFAMVLYNPYVLLFDPSFQLSFLATLGLIYFVPLLERATSWMKRFPTMQLLILSTVATQLFVLPLLLFQVGMLSLISVPVNVLVLPIVPSVMLFGLLTGVGGFVHALVALPFGFVSYSLLNYILIVVEWFSSIPFAALRIDQFPVWIVFLVYALYAVFLSYLHHKDKIDPIKAEYIK